MTLDTRGEGSTILILDINKKLSRDMFCEVSFYSTVGQTRYFVYKNNNENIWYFHKRAFFYEAPFELEGATIHNTYFKYVNNVSHAYNDSTGKFDIRADTDKYQAISDVSSLLQLIDIVQDAYSKI